MTTQNQSEFQNDHLKVSLKKEKGCKIQLDVKISPEATKASYQKAVAAIRKEISLPGFRKGKAPEAMVHQKYESFIEKEWREILLNTSFGEAIRLVKISPFNQNSVKAASLISLSKEEGSEARYEYEAAPEIPSVSPEILSIPEVKLDSVTEKEIEQTIEELSLQHGQWTDIEDRAAQEGDYVLIDVDDIGESPKNICTNTLFPLKQGKMGNWMYKLLIGISPGQTAEGMSEQDSEEDCASCQDGSHQHNHSDFQPTLCRITLNKIREAKPHPLDDGLAKKFGLSSFKELSERVKLSLEKRAENEKKNKQRQFMEEALLAQYPFEIPHSLIHDEIKLLRKRIADDLRAHGIEESKIPSEIKKHEQGAAEKYSRDYQLFFLIQKFTKEHHIEVSTDEVTMEMMQQMLARGERPTPDHAMEAQSHIRLQLLTVKALDRMIEMVEKKNLTCECRGII